MGGAPTPKWYLWFDPQPNKNRLISVRGGELFRKPSMCLIGKVPQTHPEAENVVVQAENRSGTSMGIAILDGMTDGVLASKRASSGSLSGLRFESSLLLSPFLPGPECLPGHEKTRACSGRAASAHPSELCMFYEMPSAKAEDAAKGIV